MLADDFPFEITSFFYVICEALFKDIGSVNVNDVRLQLSYDSCHVFRFESIEFMKSSLTFNGSVDFLWEQLQNGLFLGQMKDLWENGFAFFGS